MKTSLEHKTVRPGSLSSYSFYYSKRLPPQTQNAASNTAAFPISLGKLFILLVVVAAGYFAVMHFHTNSASPTHRPAATPLASTVNPSACSGNVSGKSIKVSIGQRHLWACNGPKVAYDTPVITGMTQYASTITPTGTYKIYAKQQNTVLTGSDESGSWRDPVSYWMPFLDNQYGTYGFHDATWRDNNQFGNIDPNSSQASHGCVELPLAAAAWLYSWAQVGTSLTIQA